MPASRGDLGGTAVEAGPGGTAGAGVRCGETAKLLAKVVGVAGTATGTVRRKAAVAAAYGTPRGALGDHRPRHETTNEQCHRNQRRTNGTEGEEPTCRPARTDTSRWPKTGARCAASAWRVLSPRRPPCPRGS
ncbi:hypothetical protein [Streptomyces sp. NPDC048644]|uniref:hypothetical protein n=1 Tax=Streptomyces sp. NPDC048644 TaxID=3365582 RepID=UPI0037158304